MNPSANRALLLCAMLAGTALAVHPVHAQSARLPPYSNVDSNGVDLVTGKFNFALDEGGIGSGVGAINVARYWTGTARFTDNWSGAAYENYGLSPATMVVEFGPISDSFKNPGTGWVSDKGDGASLLTNDLDSVNYTARDGTKIVFTRRSPASHFLRGEVCAASSSGVCSIPTIITRPDGTRFTLTWDFASLSGGTFVRLKTVTGSAGYSFAINYATDSPGSGSTPATDWNRKMGITFANSVTACNSSCPSVSYGVSGGIHTITDAMSRVWRLDISTGQLTGIRRPGSSSDTTSVSYGTGGLVSSVTRDGVTTNYSRSVNGNIATTTITNALSEQTVVTANISTGRITAVTDALSRTTNYTFDTNGRLTRITAPEGNYTENTYDSRGNVTQTQAVAKSGSGLSAITTTASFDSSCTNVVKCNKPNSITDPRGNTTNYTYDSTHGGLLTVTPPAPTTGADPPQTRYSYTLTAHPVSDGVSSYLLTGVSDCQSYNATCVGATDEAKTTLTYGSNMLVTGVSRGNGNGTLTASNAMTYDPAGNLLTVDGPLSGTADTTRFRYNAARERIGTVSPDPDGAGALKHRALRTTINGEGLVTKVERGTVNSQSDSDWSAFSPLEAVEAAYDANGRPTTTKLVSGSTTYGLVQTSYDALGRPECGAQRMNPAIYGSLPSSACTLGMSGSYGQDRIVKEVHDAAGQVIQVKTALGVTGEEANEVTATYTSNGQVQTVTDAENNKTTYEYDGHDRLRNRRFPSKTTDGVSAPTSGTDADFEQLTYDANSNVTSRRLRDGNSIGYTLDALNRVTVKNLPGSEPDIAYLYDAFNRMTAAVYTGNEHYFTYDALGRNLTQYSHLGTVTSTYDLAGRRTRITHPDGFYVDQEYLVTGDPTVIRENGATSGPGVLATYAYDDRGRRTTLTRGDGSVLTYTYDNVSRLTQLANDLAGTTTTYDLTLGFTPNPAGGISATTRSNDLYAWGGHYNVNRNYTANGLNQYTASGLVTLQYDAKGNLASEGSIAYSYSSENLLTSATGGNSLSYDPLMRLYQTVGSVTTRFGYDGTDLRGEYSSSNSMVRRYVHGPGTDEPLVWYEGSGTTDRRFLHADERGSIVAVTNSSGAIIGTNAYDEYGVPRSTNFGRFQYTGQTWLSDLGLYYYKARIYSPTLGRFFQSDPIGYGGGMNFYAYVGSDPVNGTDPTGLAEEKSQLGRVHCIADCGLSTSGTIFVTGDKWRSTLDTLIMLGSIQVEQLLTPSIATNSTETIFVTGTRRVRSTTPMLSAPNASACQMVQDAVDRTKGVLPKHITDTWRWGRKDALRNDWVSSRMNLSDANFIDIPLTLLEGGTVAVGLGSAFDDIIRGVQGVSKRTLAGAVAAAGAYAADLVVSNAQSQYRNEMAALEARMLQLQMESEGMCSSS